MAARSSPQGTPAEIMAEPESAHRPISHRRAADPDAGQAAQARRRARTLKSSARAATTCKNVTAEIPLGLFTCITGVSGGGKSTLIIDTLYKAVARAAERRAGAPGAASTASRASSTSTRSSTSTSRRSAARRAPTRPPTPAPSRRSATGSPACRRPRRAATSRAASRSTSRAGAARPARATASSRSRCTSCPTSTSPATCARASATTARRWRCSSSEQVHRRRARHDGRGGGRVLQGRAVDPRQDGDAGARRPRLRQGRPAGDDAVGRRGAARQALQGAVARARPGARSTSSTSRPRACTSTTWPSCWRCCTSWSTRATRWW